MKTTLSFKIEKGIFYFMMLFSSMFLIIIAPEVITYLQQHWHTLSPIVCLDFMLIGVFITILANNREVPEDRNKQKITSCDIIEIYRVKLIELISQIWDDIIKDIKDTFNDSSRYTQEICIASENFSKLLFSDCSIINVERRSRLQSEKERELSISTSFEYARLLFERVGSPIEVVQNVCTHLNIFIKYGKAPTDKNLHIPHNKKLRNVELIHFVQDIVALNHLENLNYQLFIKTVFSEWFSGDISQISSNANRIVKNPLVTNEGWEVNLKRLRDPSFKGVK